MLSVLVSILVAAIIFGLIWYVLTMIPLPAPFPQVIRVICIVIFCLWLIYALLGLTGGVDHSLLR